MAMVDVVVPVYGGWDHVERCLDSLGRQTLAPRVIVVDDASPDDTLAQLRTRSGIELIALDVNRGFAGAVNAGLAATTADVVVLVNSDVVAHPTLLERLVAPFNDPSVGSATPLLLRPDGRIDAYGICVDPTLAGYVRLHGASRPAERSPVHGLIGPYGAVAAYRRTALDAVGDLDEGIGMYGEELDLALRLDAAGWSTTAVPEATAEHVGGASAGRGSRAQRRRAAFGRGYLLRAWRVLRTRHALRAVVTEALVCAADLVLSRDAVALTGRIAGYRAGRRATPRPSGLPPHVDRGIGFLESLRLRRAGRATSADD